MLYANGFIIEWFLDIPKAMSNLKLILKYIKKTYYKKSY